MENDTGVPTDAVEPVAYLTRSDHRVQVLDAMTETIPTPGADPPGYGPQELRDVTGASEATVNRILNEFEKRGWAERNLDGEYVVTPVGQSIAIEFAPLLDSMAAIRHLGDAVALLPLDELTISLAHFRDATVREPTAPQPRDIDLFLTDFLSESSTFDILCYVPGTDRLLDELTERLAAGTLESTQILAERIVEFYAAVGPDEVQAQARAHLDAGAEWYVYDGHVPCNMFVFDECVVFENSQVTGLRDGTTIVTTDSVVREWALDVFERYQADASRFTVDDLPG